MTHPEDREVRTLMVRYQDGDMGAFEELYLYTSRMIRGYLASLCFERGQTADLVQEAYLQIHRSRHTYDPAYAVRPWILGIARHVLLTHRRRWARRSRPLTPLAEQPELPVPPEIDGLADREALGHALGRLPPDWREALVLHHVYGLAFREIGSIVGASEGAARIRASRGMALLRAELVEERKEG